MKDSLTDETQPHPGNTTAPGKHNHGRRLIVDAVVLVLGLAIIAAGLWAAYSVGRRSHRDTDARMQSIVDAVVAAREDAEGTLTASGETTGRLDRVEARLGGVEARLAHAVALLETGCVFNAQLVPLRDHGRRIALAWELAQADGDNDAEATP